MADLTKLITELMLSAQAEKDIASHNPYYSVGGGFGTIGNKVWGMVDPQDSDSLREAALVSGISSLLGGVVQGIGDDYQGTLRERYNEALQTGLPVEGLPQGLYSKAASGNMLFKIARAEEQRKRTEDLLQHFDKEMLKLRAQDIHEELKYGSGASAAPPGKQVAQKLTGAEDKPLTAAELTAGVPKELKPKAIEESGTLSNLQDAFGAVDRNIDLAFKNSTMLNSYAIGDNWLPSVSEQSKLRDTARANLTAAVLSVWKGPLDENDARRMVDPFIPDYNDSETTLNQKKAGLKQLLLQNAKQTPILESFGKAQRPTTTTPTSGGGSAPRPSPKGFSSSLDYLRAVREWEAGN